MMSNDLEPVLGKAWDVISFTINFMSNTYSKKEIVDYITKVDSLSYNELLLESLKILESKWVLKMNFNGTRKPWMMI